MSHFEELLSPPPLPPQKNSLSTLTNSQNSTTRTMGHVLHVVLNTLTLCHNTARRDNLPARVSSWVSGLLGINCERNDV